MKELKFTLLSDGSSDQALLPVLNWLLIKNGVRCAIQSEWADLRRLSHPPTRLQDKIQKSLDFYPCDLLFVHRDAEKAAYMQRIDEIKQSLEQIAPHPPIICVVPVRMQEAWLLFDETAIRRAAGNPNGACVLNLPPIDKLETLPDPKDILHSKILEATELSSHRRKKFRVSVSVRRVSEFIDDFSPLEKLSAFKMLDDDTSRVVKEQHWDT